MHDCCHFVYLAHNIEVLLEWNEVESGDGDFSCRLNLINSSIILNELHRQLKVGVITISVIGGYNPRKSTLLNGLLNYRYIHCVWSMISYQ